MPVIFEIEFKGQIGLFELTKGYTAYPGEDEVLIQDGLEYSITGNDVIGVDDKQMYRI